MNKIEINREDIRDIRDKYKGLMENRQEQNIKLQGVVNNLSKVQSNGFVEEIVEKLENHMHDVEINHIGNLKYSVDFLDAVIHDFTELDENTVK